MSDGRLTTVTVERVDGVVHHDVSGQDDIERIDRGDHSVCAYRGAGVLISAKSEAVEFLSGYARDRPSHRR